MLQKIYGRDESEPETHYSPPKVNGTKREVKIGNPDPEHVSTSYIERQNLTMRMSMRRFTHLSNGFSKKIQNHAHAVEIHFMYYNFARIHKSLRVTPAMEAGGFASRLVARRNYWAAGFKLRHYRWLYVAFPSWKLKLVFVPVDTCTDPASTDSKPLSV